MFYPLWVSTPSPAAVSQASSHQQVAGVHQPCARTAPAEPEQSLPLPCALRLKAASLLGTNTESVSRAGGESLRA